ncbi:phosphotransferase [Nocardia asteroides]|uniref:phosphotransferase n=1 Tax=Nocardia asteroides TaxID=1824 RepID=UPI003B3BB981
MADPTTAIARHPVALYKDSDIRNFILADDQVAILDFDDLTLAPFGYDLAELIVNGRMSGQGDIVTGTDSGGVGFVRPPRLSACSPAGTRSPPEPRRPRSRRATTPRSA